MSKESISNNKLPFEIVHIELANSYIDTQKIAQKYNAKLPTLKQLGQLATYLYNYDGTIGAKQDISSGINLDTTKTSQIISASPFSDQFYVWSRQSYSQYFAYYRRFSPTYTGWYGTNRKASYGLAVCVRETCAENVRDKLESDVKKWMEELDKRYVHNTVTAGNIIWV